MLAGELCLPRGGWMLHQLSRRLQDPHVLSTPLKWPKCNVDADLFAQLGFF
jgi:hypothetical protein